MNYLGGKTRLARRIADTVALYRRPGLDTYVEPFLGGGSVASLLAPTFETALLSDIHPDLMALWEALAAGWIPPEVTEEDYRRAHQSYTQGEPASALRGFLGFGCSFGGKWFGGWARNGRGYDYAGQARRELLKKAPGLRDATFRVGAYPDEVPDSAVVYADPPYAGTTGYSHSFDHQRFWETAESWVNGGALVLVSEYAAPPEWVEVWGVDLRVSVASGVTPATTKTATDKLFVHWKELLR